MPMGKLKTLLLCPFTVFCVVLGALCAPALGADGAVPEPDTLQSVTTDEVMELYQPYASKITPYMPIYFIVYVFLISTSLTLMAVPILSSIGLPVVSFGDVHYYAPLKLLPITIITGLLLATLTMHLAKLMGKWHGRFAKFMLVGE